MLFGVELEHVGLSPQNVAHILSHAWNNPSRCSSRDAWGCNCPEDVEDPQGRTWECTSDGSLNDASGACELKTPPLPFAQGLEDVLDVAQVLRAAGGRADGSCGGHVHVDASQMRACHMRDLVEFYSQIQGRLYRAVRVREDRHRWATFTSSYVVGSLRGLPSTRLKIWEFKETMIPAQGSRYIGLNLCSLAHHGTVEWRLFNGTLSATNLTRNVCLAVGIQRAALKGKLPSVATTDRMGTMLRASWPKKHLGVLTRFLQSWEEEGN